MQHSRLLPLCHATFPICLSTIILSPFHNYTQYSFLFWLIYFTTFPFMPNRPDTPHCRLPFLLPLYPVNLFLPLYNSTTLPSLPLLLHHTFSHSATLPHILSYCHSTTHSSLLPLHHDRISSPLPPPHPSLPSSVNDAISQRYFTSAIIISSILQ